MRGAVTVKCQYHHSYSLRYAYMEYGWLQLCTFLIFNSNSKLITYPKHISVDRVNAVALTDKSYPYLRCNDVIRILHRKVEESLEFTS